jgi:uncharacterized protein YbcI
MINIANGLTKGQVEDLISKTVTQYYVKTLGVGPRQTRSYIVEDMVIIRLQGKLSPIEQKLLESQQGIELVKNIRKALHETTTKSLSELVKKITNYRVISIHSDISTKTGEIVQIYVLNENLENEFNPDR